MKTHFCTALLVALMVAGGAAGDVQVGDKPSLKFNDFTTHKAVNLADLHGKIVIVDFWATWCGPCMGEAPHIVAINDKYSSKGLQMIGISLDEDPSALKTVMTEKKFTWPMSFEGSAWSGSIPKAWGINSIPQTFIIGPDGDVLWRGHPAAIDAVLAKAFAEHPPQLVDPATLAQAKATLDEIEKDLDAQEPSKAVKLMAGIPEEAKLDGDVAGRITAASDKLQKYGNTELAGIDPLIQSQQYSAAVKKLRELSQAFAGTPVAASAKTKLTELSSNPKVKQALEAEKAEKAAGADLAIANKLKADKKDELA